MDKIAVLVPCYNEAKTVQKVVTDFRRVLPGCTVYVYDNNSTDGTAELAKDAGAVVRQEYRQGKGHVIRRMFREIDAECYVMVDGDDTYPAECAPALVAPILGKKADMVVGDRLSSTYFTENKRPFHNFGNTLVRGTINTIFHSDIKDVMTGYRAFNYQFVKSFPVLSKGFEIETEMTIHAIDKNMYVENVVIDYRDRPQGSESKLNTYSDGFKVLRTVGRLFRSYKPFGYFSLIAAILKVDWKVSLPPHIAERVVTTGYVEWGATPQFEAAEHGNHVAESCRLTDAHFGQQGPRAMHGVYGKGTDTIVCHTGTSPNSGMNACAIAGAWNWLVDLATADEEASRG